MDHSFPRGLQTAHCPLDSHTSLKMRLSLNRLRTSTLLSRRDFGYALSSCFSQDETLAQQPMHLQDFGQIAYESSRFSQNETLAKSLAHWQHTVHDIKFHARWRCSAQHKIPRKMDVQRTITHNSTQDGRATHNNT